MISESYKEKDDYDLVAKSLNGDKKAFGEIVNRYQKMVARTVKGMLGDSMASEDVGQDVFVKLYQALSDFRGESKLSTYIQRIAINFTLNEIKRRDRFLAKFSGKGTDDINEFDSLSGDDQGKRDAKEIVGIALRNLDPKYRIIVVMRMLEGYSTKETAELLGLPLGTVLSRLSRAQEQLRQMIKKI